MNGAASAAKKAANAAARAAAKAALVNPTPMMGDEQDDDAEQNSQFDDTTPSDAGTFQSVPNQIGVAKRKRSSPTVGKEEEDASGVASEDVEPANCGRRVKRPRSALASIHSFYDQAPRLGSASRDASAGPSPHLQPPCVNAGESMRGACGRPTSNLNVPVAQEEASGTGSTQLANRLDLNGTGYGGQTYGGQTYGG